MRRRGQLWAALGALALGVCLTGTGAFAADRPPRDGFYYGIPQVEAEKLLKNTTEYEVAYRVDTVSTADIFVRYRQHTLYLGHFLQGECVSVEKRAIVTSEDRERMFAAYAAKLGGADEASSSSDGRMHYAKWTWADRTLELSANARADGAWLLSHEEYDPQRMREAVLAQQRELRDSRAQLDPLTGLPVGAALTAGEQAAAAQAISPGDPAWEDALPDDNTDEDAAPQDEGPEAQRQRRDHPRITDRDDWD